MNTATNPTESLQTLRDLLLAKPLLEWLLPVFKRVGAQPILVGGMLRDYLMNGHIGCDLDFIVPADAFAPLCRLLAAEYQGHVIPLDPENGIARIVFPDTPEYIDVATQQGENLLADLARRDLSINAIAMDLETGEVFDPHHGIADIAAQCIQLIRASNLDDDPLRLLRAFRFAGRFPHPIITPDTRQAIHERAHLIAQPAVERSQYECQSLFSSLTLDKTTPELIASGLLPVLFPELTHTPATATSFQNGLAVLDSTLQAEKFPASLYADLTTPLTPCLTRLGVLRYALYLATHGLSSEALTPLGKRLKWSQQLTQRLQSALRSLAVVECAPESLTEEGFILNALAKAIGASQTPQQAGEISPPAGSLFSFGAESSALSVQLSSKSKTIFIETILERINIDWSELSAYREREATMPHWLSGHDIQHRWGLQPGPRIGDLLKALRQAQHQGQVENQSDAIAFVENALRPA